VEADQTVRQQIISLLSESELTSLDLSQLVHIREKEVADHLNHISRTLHSQGKKLKVDPYQCMDCNYQFKKRDRFDRPGRCPKCKGSHIRMALYSII
jgi:predicted Zn-ribbon and HTH transcriptional regulator